MMQGTMLRAEYSMNEAFGKALRKMLEDNPKVLFLDSDVSMDQVIGKEALEQYPERIRNVGIAEANMIGMACGLSLEGMIPFTHTFGCFAAKRVLDQVFLSGSFGGASVKMLGSMPGITAEINGGTHMPFDDLAIMRTIPQMTVLEPSDIVQGDWALKAASEIQGMFYLRWERKGQYRFYDFGSTFEIGKAVILKEGTDAAILAAGNLMLQEAMLAAEKLEQKGITAAVADFFSIKPIDADMIYRLAEKTGCIITAENHSVIGGLGSAVSEILSKTDIPCKLEMIGVQDRFGVVGRLAELQQYYGLCSDDICNSVIRAIERRRRGES